MPHCNFTTSPKSLSPSHSLSEITPARFSSARTGTENKRDRQDIYTLAYQNREYNFHIQHHMHIIVLRVARPNQKWPNKSQPCSNTTWTRHMNTSHMIRNLCPSTFMAIPTSGQFRLQYWLYHHRLKATKVCILCKHNSARLMRFMHA